MHILMSPNYLSLDPLYTLSGCVLGSTPFNKRTTIVENTHILLDLIHESMDQFVCLK